MRNIDTIQAIITKLFPSKTGSLVGASILADCIDGKCTYEFNPSYSQRENHTLAAQRFCEDLGWHGRFIAAHLPDDRCCFVSITDQAAEIPAFVC